jgi:hypothetical protein
MTTTNSTVLKIVAVLGIAALAVMAFAVMPARAQTTTTTTTTTVSVSPFVRDLTMGSRGTDVSALQAWLISKGFSIPAGPTGYFWTQTRAAVAAFQAAHGITPTAGYFGPITRGVVNAMLAGGNPGGGGGDTGGALKGAGRLTNVDELGDVESSLDEGDNDVQVVGVEAEAKDGDVRLQRLDVEFDLTGTSGSTRLDRYIDNASVWLGSKKLATMDASDADKNGSVWTMRFADLNGIIREGDTGQIHVSVDAVSNIDTDDAGNDIDATIPEDGLRVVSADGVSETYIDSDITNTFDVSEASNGTVTLTEASDNPDDTVVEVDEDSSTDDVTLMSLGIRARHQDVTINDLPVDLSVTGTSNVSDVVQSVRLMKGSKTLDTATVSGSGTSARVVFNDLDETIDADDTETYDVVADIRRVQTAGGGSAFTTGDTLTASTSNNSSWDIEDEDCEDL